MIKYLNYDNYDDYVKHQSEKVEYMGKRLSDLRNNHYKLFKEEFQELLPAPFNQKILCLGARNGLEVEVLRELKFSAIGIDLNPKSNLVEKGDFHNINYPDNSFDYVYINCLDHCQDIDKVLNEVKRVLKKSGKFYVRLTQHSFYNPEKFSYECCFWNNIQEIEKEILKYFLFIEKKQSSWPNSFNILWRNKK